MIKINLLAERKPAKAAKSASSMKPEFSGGSQSFLLGAIMLLGLAVAAAWSWSSHNELKTWEQKNRDADRELVRLQEIRKKGDLYKAQKELLERKIQLITDLKRKQSVPVHILDQISKNLPDFLWLDTMAVTNNQISITGKATTYNAVSNFFNNLNASGVFQDVTMGKAAEVAQGVSFNLSCRFAPPAPAAPEGAPAEGEAPAAPEPPAAPKG